MANTSATEMRSALSLAAILALVGCVTPGGGVQQARPSTNDDPSIGCMAEIGVDKRFVPLREKIAINLRPEKATLEMMSDPTTPTGDEKKLLGVWKIARDTCLDRGASFRAQYAPPEYRSNIAIGTAAVDALTARLYAGEITYGQFNRERASNAVQGQARGAALEQREREANAAAAAQEEDRRRQAAGMALQNMQNQQLIQQQQRAYQMPIPRQTTCTSRRIGSQVETVCQ